MHCMCLEWLVCTCVWLELILCCLLFGCFVVTTLSSLYSGLILFVRLFSSCKIWSIFVFSFFFQAEDGIRDLVRSRGLGDVYKRQTRNPCRITGASWHLSAVVANPGSCMKVYRHEYLLIGNGVDRFKTALGLHKPGRACFLYPYYAAGQRSSVELGGCRIIKKKTMKQEDRRE